MKRITLVAICLVFVAASANAQLKKPEYARVMAPPTPIAATPGGTVEIPVYLQVQQGYHINADKPTFDYLIPTKLDWASTDLKLEGVKYPPAEKHKLETGEELDVYQNDVKIVSRFQVPKTEKPGKLMLQGKVRYQACDAKVCYAPVTVPFEAPIEVVTKKG